MDWRVTTLLKTGLKVGGSVCFMGCLWFHGHADAWHLLIPQFDSHRPTDVRAAGAASATSSPFSALVGWVS
jgi:hypothetical protein